MRSHYDVILISNYGVDASHEDDIYISGQCVSYLTCMYTHAILYEIWSMEYVHTHVPTLGIIKILILHVFEQVKLMILCSSTRTAGMWKEAKKLLSLFWSLCSETIRSVILGILQPVASKWILGALCMCILLPWPGTQH